MQSGRYFLGVPLAVQLEKPVKYLVLRRWANCEARTVWRLPVMVIEVQITPAVGIADSLI